MIDQCEPSQCSAKGPVDAPPTAKQLIELGHDTSANEPLGGPAGLALGTTDHEAAAPTGPTCATVTPVTSAMAISVRAAGAVPRRRHRLTASPTRMRPPLPDHVSDAGTPLQ
jgi:hypothetical protein